jgi:hypothetical protein
MTESLAQIVLQKKKTYFHSEGTTVRWVVFSGGVFYLGLIQRSQNLISKKQE